jgi:hypothetical protein
MALLFFYLMWRDRVMNRTRMMVRRRNEGMWRRRMMMSRSSLWTGARHNLFLWSKSRCIIILNIISGLSHDGTKLNHCSKCKKVFYCCKEHQKDDWKRHKKTCV